MKHVIRSLSAVAVVASAILAQSGPAVLARPGAVSMAQPGGAAPRYEARRAGEVVQLEDTKQQIVVSILTSVGNIAHAMTVKGHNVLRFPFESVDEFKARPVGMHGIPLMAPWANRLDEQAFYANGKRYPFDMDLGNVTGTIPIHGFMTRTDQWQVVEMQQDGSAAWLTSRLEAFRQPSWMKQWPFAHTIEMTYRLADGELEVRTTIANHSTEPMPVSIGYHPYFQLTDSTRDEWTVTVPARTRWLLSGQKLPTGETEPTDGFFDQFTGALKDYNLDDVFTDLVRDERGLATATLKGRAQRIDVSQGPNYRALVVYSPNPANTGRGSQIPAPGQGQAPAPPRPASPAPPNPRATPNFVCFEPMAGITNALNLAHKGIYRELQSIAPGASWHERFWVRPSGF
jgi:aldose 1-epimerase